MTIIVEASVAFDDEGNFIVVWANRSYLNGPSNIYGQAFDKTGNPIGSNFMVTYPDSLGNYRNPDIEYRADGSFVVIWEKMFGGVFAQIYSNEREKIGDPIVVYYCQYDYSLNPELAVNSNGDFAVAWQSDKKYDGKSLMQLFDKMGDRIDTTVIFPNGSMLHPKLEYLNNEKLVLAWTEVSYQSDNNRVCVQLLSESGATIGDVITVDSETTRSFGNLALSSSAGDQFIITWERENNIYAQRYSNNGASIGETLVVNNKSEIAYRYEPAISANTIGEFIITWATSSGNSGDITFQRYAETGERINDNRSAIIGASGSVQENSVIEVSSDGKYVIAWEDEKEGYASIYAKIFDEQNQPICEAIKLVDENVSSKQIRPSIAINGNDKVLIVWNGRREDGLENIYGQFLSLDGVKIGSNIKISDSENNWGAEIGSGGNDNFVVTWNHNTESGVGNDIYGQRLNSNGEKLGANFRVSEDEYDGSRSSVAVNYDNSFIVTWKGSQPDRGTVVFARRFTSEAVPLGNSFIVTKADRPDTPQSQIAPVIIDSNGNTTICWTEYRTGYDREILFSKYDNRGQLIISNKVLNGPLPTREWFSEIAIDDSSDDFIVVWEEFIDGSYDILAQQVGDPMGEIFRITNTSDGIQSFPNLKVRNNKIYSTWTDNRIENSGFDVWANVLNWNSPTDINDVSTIEEFKLSQNYPNPFNPSTTIKYSIPNVETRHASSLRNVILKVYDILGREIATLVNKKQQAGSYEVQFDASSLTSGIYLYKLRSGSFVESKKMILVK